MIAYTYKKYRKLFWVTTSGKLRAEIEQVSGRNYQVRRKILMQPKRARNKWKSKCTKWQEKGTKLLRAWFYPGLGKQQFWLDVAMSIEGK